MIRFALKSAFALGIASLVIPGLGSNDDDAAQLDMLQELVGVQAAVKDVLGFCTRAPEACETGARLGTFALDRVESGLAIAIDAGGRGSTLPIAVTVDGSPEGFNVPATNWSTFDPALLVELQAAAESDGEIGPSELSPEVLEAVREMAAMAAGILPEDSQNEARPERRSEPAGRHANPTHDIPTPRPRPGL